jgi:exoribonuclease II
MSITLKPLDSTIDVKSTKVILAEYDSSNRLTNVSIISNSTSAIDNATFNVTLPNGNYKLMIWDEDKTPVVKSKSIITTN